MAGHPIGAELSEPGTLELTRLNSPSFALEPGRSNPRLNDYGEAFALREALRSSRFDGWLLPEGASRSA